MNEGRSFEFTNTGEGIDQLFGIMPVHRTDIAETEVLEQASWDENAFDCFIDTVGIPGNILTNSGNGEEHLVNFLLELGHDLPGHDLAQVRRHATDIGRD